MVEALAEAVDQALDRRRLVAGRLERGDELEVGHRSQFTTVAHEPNRCSGFSAAVGDARAARRPSAAVDDRAASRRRDRDVSIDPRRRRPEALASSRPGPRSAASASPAIVPRPTRRSRWTSASQVTSQTSSHSSASPPSTSLIASIDDGRAPRPLGLPRSRPGSAAGPPGGRSPRGRAARRVGEHERPSAARSSSPSGRESSSPNRAMTASTAGSPGASDVAGDPVRIDDDDAGPLAEPAARPSTCRSRSAR